MDVKAIGSATRQIAMGPSVTRFPFTPYQRVTYPEARAGSWESHRSRLEIVFPERSTPYSLKLCKILTRPPSGHTVQKLLVK